MFADRLKSARKAAGLTQHALAEKVGIRSASIAQMETGLTKFPSSKNLLPLARALDVDPEWLISGKGQPKPPSNEVREPAAEYCAHNQQEQMMLDLFRNLPEEDRRRALQYVRDAVELRQLRAKKQANGN